MWLWQSCFHKNTRGRGFIRKIVSILLNLSWAISHRGRFFPISRQCGASISLDKYNFMRVNHAYSQEARILEKQIFPNGWQDVDPALLVEVCSSISELDCFLLSVSLMSTKNLSLLELYLSFLSRQPSLEENGFYGTLRLYLSELKRTQWILVITNLPSCLTNEGCLRQYATTSLMYDLSRKHVFCTNPVNKIVQQQNDNWTKLLWPFQFGGHALFIIPPWNHFTFLSVLLDVGLLDSSHECILR